MNNYSENFGHNYNRDDFPYQQNGGEPLSSQNRAFTSSPGSKLRKSSWGMDLLTVMASFILIFAFQSVDNAISPMVESIHKFYRVPLNQVLLLISYCTMGIVIGVFIGPTLTASFRVFHLIFIGVVGLSLSLVPFLILRDFQTVLYFRFAFGLFAGIIASCMWWLTYYGVSSDYYQPMIAVLMSARPVAIALGVPLAGLIASRTSWRFPFGIFLVLIFLSGFILLISVKKDEGTKIPFNLGGFIGDYLESLQVPYVFTYYLGFTINRICYFGFYSMAGIWFIIHYNLPLVHITSALLLVGLGEALVNFLIPSLLKLIGHDGLFTFSVLLSGIVFAVFVGGSLSLPVAVILICLFVCLDRIYCMAMIISIPHMFPQARNKTVMGSLNTLTAWIALTAISGFAGSFIRSGHVAFKTDLIIIQWILLGSFILGSLIMFYVQYKTVLFKRDALS